ncbi:hypothetical protein [Piscinibacter sp.]|uniref:hypothetical protein n=1 Tax=Piscinibacter sp. TaxID=1903157 RepID=UPI0039E435E1
MKTARRLSDGFVTGFVTTGCVSAFRDQAAPATPAQAKRVLRHALQGGAALAAGQQAAACWQRGDVARALAATAAGAAGVLLIERLLRDDGAPRRQKTREKSDGQEA